MPPSSIKKTKLEVKMAKIKELCQQKLAKVIEDMGYELVDVSYEKENGGMSLIFTIDCDAGVTIDDCEKVTKVIDPLLDELNPTDDKPYTLVVSSPGLDRPLKTDRDFKKNLGNEVEINLFAKIDGKKAFTGTLKSFDEKTVTFEIEGQDKTFDREKVASIKLVIKF